MRIGVPKERKAGERRVAIVPDGVSELCAGGNEVLIEQGAGALAGFTDEEFRSAGATLTPSLEEVWTKSDLLIKVKEPAPEELKYFRKGHAIFSFLHLAVAPELTKAMVEQGVTGLDYDLLQLDDGRLPILEPMSVIAGKLAVQCGATALQAPARGLLLGGAPGVRPARVLVLGAGASGGNAARVALGMGAEVTLVDISTVKLAPFAELGIRTILSNRAALRRELSEADLVIGAVLIPGALAPKLIKRTDLPAMRPGSVLVDVCIDQGGVAESSRPTSIAEPTYVESGVLHYCVPNMPALVPRTSTEALTNASLPWLKILAKDGVERAIRDNLPIRRSLTSYGGKLTNLVIGQALGMPATPPDDIL